MFEVVVGFSARQAASLPPDITGTSAAASNIGLAEIQVFGC